MAIDLDRFEELKSKVESLRRDRDRAEGALAQTMVRLKKEYGCRTLKEAKQLLTKTRKEAVEAEKSFKDELSDFNERWGDRLNSDED